ncbi:MAG: hypothetical protein F4051_03540 [Boseongicola sp. SB0670_bin_30]|nr:hypothetical protein [Boseongicola sp. SB0670_bin_30]
MIVRPLPDWVRHTDRGVQYAALRHRRIMTLRGLVGSMSRRGNPCDSAQAESFLKTLKVERVCVGDCETFEDVAADMPRFIQGVCNATCLHSAPGCLSPNKLEEMNAPDESKSAG